MNTYEIEFNQSFIGEREIVEAESEDEARNKIDDTWGLGVGAELEIFSVSKIQTKK